MKPPAGILPAFPKPKDLEGKVTLAARKARSQLDLKIIEQNNKCAICGGEMDASSEYYMPTRDHIKPEPAGCAKDDRDENIRAAHWICNYRKGSKRT